MRVHIKKKEVVSDDHALLQKISYELEKPGGERTGQEREVYDHGNAVAAVLYNQEEGKILLTKQFRLPTYMNGNPTGFLIEACAGIVEKGEDPDETMKREILEETGFEVREVEKVHEAYSSAGVLTELLTLYLAPYNPGMKVEKGGGLKEEGEDIELIELGAEEVRSMLQKGEIRDAKTIILLQHLIMNIFI